MSNEQPAGQGPEAEKEEGGAEEKKQKGNLIMRMARGILRATGRVGYPEEIPNADSKGKEQKDQEQKKEASQAMSTMGFGTATLGGLIALVFAGMVVGVQKLNAWSKSFEAGFKLAYPGGGKGGGGKKEKA